MTPRAGTSRTATTERRTSGRSGADHRESRAVRYRRRMTSRTRVEVTGVVQGVGFRPFVHRLATAAGLSGFVGNDGDGVFIELEGDPASIDQVVAQLSASPPLLAHVDTVTARSVAP